MTQPTTSATRLLFPHLFPILQRKNCVNVLPEHAISLLAMPTIYWPRNYSDTALTTITPPLTLPSVFAALRRTCPFRLLHSARKSSPLSPLKRAEGKRIKNKFLSRLTCSYNRIILLDDGFRRGGDSVDSVSKLPEPWAAPARLGVQRAPIFREPTANPVDTTVHAP